MSNYQSICFYCTKHSDKVLQRCSKCKFVHYCSTECQKKDWKEYHKQDCPPINYGLNIPITLDKKYVIVTASMLVLVYEKKTHEEIWKKLVEICQEPFLKRNIYDESKQKFIERYPFSELNFKYKITTLIKCYLKKRHEKLPYVQKKLIKEEWNCKTKVGGTLSQKTITPVLLIAKKFSKDHQAYAKVLDPWGAEIEYPNYLDLFIDTPIDGYEQHLEIKPESKNIKALDNCGFFCITDWLEWDKFKKKLQN